MRVLVIAPHPDDETLGCGGTLLKHRENGDEIFWLIVTNIDSNSDWSDEAKMKRKNEIDEVNKCYEFSKIFNFSYPTMKMDTVPFSDLIDKFVQVYKKIEPQLIYMPFYNDVHTDHQFISKAVQSTLKWFRYPYIEKVLMYETLSETDFNFIDRNNFMPNIFIDISKFIDKKVEVMKTYDSEINEYPFPRSETSIRSLAAVRGSQCGFLAAESFMLVYEKIK